MVTDQPIGRAVLYVSSNVEPRAHRAFSDWCDQIHHFDTMRIEGFASLRRFELVDGISEPGVPTFRLLTLYQVRAPEDADFSTPSYAAHTASYTPPPVGVTDAITFERVVLTRVPPPAVSTEPVGAALVSVTGAPGAWLDDLAAIASREPGVHVATRAENDERGALLVEVTGVDAGLAVLRTLRDVDHGGARRALQVFGQVFPREGVLTRDRKVRAPR